MNTPGCDSELKSGELCQSCRKKLEEGRNTQLDFDIAQILFKINDRYHIRNASFYQALDLGRVVLVLTHGEVGLLIGRQGKVVSEISSALGKKVRIAEASGDVKKTVADIIMPARLLGKNKVFHNGQEVMKVRIAQSDIALLPLDQKSLDIVLRSLLEDNVMVSFE